MTYRYTINGADVSPRGDWEIDYQRNVGQIFFRRILTGDLTFLGDDYQTIIAMDDCDVLEFKIYCGVTKHWVGEFKFPYDFDIDEDSCAMVGTPEVVDEYTCIMNNYDTEYDLFMGIGGLASELRDCGGALIIGLSVAFPIGVSGTGTQSTDILNTLIRGATFMNCDIELRSSFMWRDDFPNGTNYAGAYGTDNYITGATNRLEFVRLLRNSALRNTFGGSNCDTPLKWKFKDFEDMLRNRFNAYWFIDVDGHFRIEHIHFFDPDFPESDFETGIDLTSLVSSNGKVYAYRRNKYTYETGDLYDQELWTWQHWEGTEGGAAHNQDFEGTPIFYGDTLGEKSSCVPGDFKEKVVATPNFWSDIEWGFGLATVLINPGGSAEPDTIGCPGFCMLDIDTGTGYLNCETGALSGGAVPNGHVSTANLQDHYFQYDRVFLDGDMNDGDVILFQTAEKLKLQEPIEFDWCCMDEFDAANLIRTEMGNGVIKTVVQKKRSIEVELLY